MISIPRLLLFAGVGLLTTACGKKGVLIYPDMLVPAAPAAVTAYQSGSVVKLQFTLPDKDRAGRNLKSVSGVKISKRTNDASLKDVCNSCTTDYHLFRTLYVDLLPTDTQRIGKRLIMLDSDVSAGNFYSYKIVPFTVDGLNGAESATAGVKVGAPIPAPVVRIESFPTEVRLHLSSEPIHAGQILGYNLYRSSSTASRSYLPINSEPLKGNEYVDTLLERGVTYRYSARTLIIMESGGVAEGDGSQEVEGLLKDDE